jgi:hypothetical protein
MCVRVDCGEEQVPTAAPSRDRLASDSALNDGGPTACTLPDSGASQALLLNAMYARAGWSTEPAPGGMSDACSSVPERWRSRHTRTEQSSPTQ